jgi:predicted ATP-binding protein involved in virulence
VQFFITTHSPTVVANFENGSLYIINENNIIKQNATYFGKEINAILRNVLGANDRHVPTQLKIDRLLNLIDTDPNNQTIEILLNELKDQIGADDPDLQKAISLWELSKYED